MVQHNYSEVIKIYGTTWQQKGFCPSRAQREYGRTFKTDKITKKFKYQRHFIDVERLGCTNTSKEIRIQIS